MYKKLILYTGCALMLTGLCGCQKYEPGRLSTITKEESKIKPQDKLELLNLFNDLYMFNQFNDMKNNELRALEKGETTLDKIGEENIDDEEKAAKQELEDIFSNKEDSSENLGLDDETRKKKSSIILVDYINNVYNLALSRLSADIETVYTGTKEYMNYIAMLQVFADSYKVDQEKFQEMMLEGNIGAFELDGYKTFEKVEKYYMDLTKNL